MSPATSIAVMGHPRPFPVDPSLDAWNNTNVNSLDLDGLLYPSNGGPFPLLHDRSGPLPGASGSTTHSPEFHLPSIRETDSVTKWNDDPTGPWTSLRNTGSTGHSMIYQPISQRTPPGMNLRNPRELSEVSATTTGPYQPDSTYGSRSFFSNSEGSLDPPNQSQGCPSVAVDLRGLNFHSNRGGSNYRTGSAASQDDHFSSLDGSSDTSQQARSLATLNCPWNDCEHISKNNSEHK